MPKFMKIILFRADESVVVPARPLGFGIQNIRDRSFCYETFADGIFAARIFTFRMFSALTFFRGIF